MQETNMPDVNQGANLQQVYTWVYNGGSYGKKPSVADLMTKGWLPLITGRLLYWDTSNKDLRVSEHFRSLVTEENSLTISTRILENVYINNAQVPSFSGYASQAATLKKIPILNVDSRTLDGSGASAAADVIAALTSYYGVIKITKIWADFTDPNTEITFSSTSGIVGPGTIQLNLTANQTCEVNDGVIIYGTADNEAIQMSVSGGSAGGVLIVQFETWYET